MLEIRNITKDYKTSGETVHALRDVSISFRESELVAILGHSGCGKTTLLNIIGGLDQYTSGDLIINGKSTKEFKARDWDTYRNHSVGFIFQSYNLIPHQSVLSNVELALTLSGISKSERRKRAKEALEKVGLGDQLHKRPNQMSGGQMQRVAIARALVNDPDILLADEPTGALDSETSVQIMDLIKEIAEDRLVIMVTHNPELAEQYSTRIVKLVDGKIKSDSMPFDGSEEKTEKKPKKEKGSKKSKMSFLTALALSRNNLLTKKGRTFLTSFAGSIGIIGIALILSLSNGVQLYIDDVERSTLSQYPVQIQGQSVDMGSLIESMMGTAKDEREKDREPDKIYTNDISTEMVKTMLSEITTNNLKDFKEFLETNPEDIMSSIQEIQYTYNSALYVFGKDLNGKTIQINPSTVMQAMLGSEMMGTMSQMSSSYSSLMGGSGSMAGTNAFIELLKDETVRREYELLAGKYPESYNEVVLVVNDRNEISDITLYSLGLRDQEELSEMMKQLMAGEKIDVDTGDMVFTYEDFIGDKSKGKEPMKFRLLVPSDFYQKNASGGYDDMREDQLFMGEALKKAPELTVVGVIRPNSDSIIAIGKNGGIGYTHGLTEFMINRANESELVRLQKENPEKDILTGTDFKKPEDNKNMSKEQIIQAMLAAASDEQLRQFAGIILNDLSDDQKNEFMQAVFEGMTDEQKMEFLQLPVEQQAQALINMMDAKNLFEAAMNTITNEQFEAYKRLLEKMSPKTDATYESNLEKLGAADLLKPSGISIYAKNFEGKEKVSQLISDYNDRKKAEGKEEDVINYTDYIGLIISSVSTIIDSISYILIAFVAISLVVSSIMIGIITYISVLERTKEIGILRAMGASKRDISNVFNAETLIVGFAAGAIGILVTLLLNLPINVIIEYLTGIKNMSKLPVVGGVALVLISMALTLIAGLFPASVASRKDPVEALRTE